MPRSRVSSIDRDLHYYEGYKLARRESTGWDCSLLRKEIRRRFVGQAAAPTLHAESSAGIIDAMTDELIRRLAAPRLIGIDGRRWA